MQDSAANPKFEFIKGDIRDAATCDRACEGADYVLHQAAEVSVPESIEQPVSYTMTNIIGTVNVMEAAAKHGVKKMTYASSAAVVPATMRRCRSERRSSDGASRRMQ